MAALMALPGHVLQSGLVRGVFVSGKECMRFGFHLGIAPIKLSLALTGTAGRGAEKAVRTVSQTASKLLLEIKMEQDDLLALLSEADMEQAYRDANISFKVSNYMLLQMHNQMQAQAASASCIQRIWRQHLEHRRYQALRQHPRAKAWRQQSASVKAHLLQKVKDMQDDVTWLEGRVQVLEGEKAEGQEQFNILQAEGLVLLRQVTDLTGQKAELVGKVKVVEVRVTGLEVQVTDLSSAVEDFKEKARVAREEQSQQQQGHGAEVKQLKGLIAQKNKDFSARQGHLDSLKKQLAEASARVSSLTSDLGASQQSHHNAVQGYNAEVQQLKDVVTKQGKETVSMQGVVDSLQKQLAKSSAQVSTLTSELAASQQCYLNVAQVHSAELESLKGSIAQKDKESSVMQAQMERLQNQLADRSSHVSSLNLKTAQQSNNIVKGPLKGPNQLHERSLLNGLKGRGESFSPTQAAPGTPDQQPQGLAAIDALLTWHAAKGATSLVPGLAVADEQPPPLTSASQAGALSKEMMQCEPPGTSTRADSDPGGGSTSPTTTDLAGTRAARYSPPGDGLSTMPLGRASQNASTCHLPPGVPPLQEAPEAVFTPQGIRITYLSSFHRDYQASVRNNFDGLKHGGRLVLNELLQLDTRKQILTACDKAKCSGRAAERFAEGLCKAKQKAGGREAAKAARRAAAASASVATSAPHAPSFANGRASSTAPPPPLMAGGPPGFENMGGNGGTLMAGSPPPGFEHMGGNGGISGHDNGRRFGCGGHAATKQLPQLPITAEERPGLSVPSPAQSNAPVKSSWAALASGSAAAQIGPVRRRQPPKAAQAATPLQVGQQPRTQQPVGQGRQPSALVRPRPVPASRSSTQAVGLNNIAGSNNCCVNVVVQVLRHCPSMQTWLLNVTLPDKYQGQEVVEQLVQLFNIMDELEAAPQSMCAADPQGFRSALAALDKRFPQGPMLDAADILEVIYEVVDKLALALGGPQLFQSAYQEFVWCPDCQRQTFVFLHSPCLLVANAREVAERKETLRLGQHLFQTMITQRSCNTDEDGCGVKHLVQLRLRGAPPAVLTVQLQYLTSHPSSSAVQKILDGIDMVLILGDLYPHLQQDIHYQLQEVVCFREAHYVCYCRQLSGGWWKHDDRTVRYLVDWSAVCMDCIMGDCHPTILMYGKV